MKLLNYSTNKSSSPTFITLISSVVTLLLLNYQCPPIRHVSCHQQDEISQQLQFSLWLDGDPSPTSAKLSELLNRTGPNMRASADYRDFPDIQLAESMEAWRILHDRSWTIARNQVRLFRPKLMRLLKDANVTGDCFDSVQHMLNSMENFDSWAIQMWSSTGNFPPIGFFDGQFTDLGSYKGCVEVNIQRQTSRDQQLKTASNQQQQQPLKPTTSYCIVPLRPIVPSRPPFHMIFKREPQTLVGMFNQGDAFASIVEFAQFFHYVYLKTGVCVPSACSPHDIQRMAKVVGRRLAMMSGPVRCFTRAIDSEPSNRTLDAASHQNEEYNFTKIEDEPVLVRLSRQLNKKQKVSLAIVAGFFGLVSLATLWHLAELGASLLGSWWTRPGGQSDDNAVDHDDDDNDDDYEEEDHNGHDLDGSKQVCNGAHVGEKKPMTIEPLASERTRSETNLVKHVAFEYLSVVTNGCEFFDTSLRPHEIKCLHGLRVLTMIWIICVHTLQYNEWAGFMRAFQIVGSLQNPLLHPILNANYVVDNFFLMSGLLAAYTTWHAANRQRQGTAQFSILTSLLGRYLRLTPQAMLISLLYILLPLVGEGPFWYDMTHYASKYCERNWWLNLLHIQSFYRKHEMCNLVGWWISVDMFYYVLALGIIWMILRDQRRRLPLRALAVTSAIVGYCLLVAGRQHYLGGYTPNNLAVVPQVAEVWTNFVVSYSWSPYPHAYVFFLGLWLGYLLANNMGRRLVRRWSRLGWLLSLSSLLLTNMSSHLWMSGQLELGAQWISTGYNLLCTIIWANSLSWIIMACHYGCAPLLNRLASARVSILLSKASFIIYLSHMLLVRYTYGSQFALFEVSIATILQVVLANVVGGCLLGVFLAITFEGPWMKLQRQVMRRIKSSSSSNNNNRSTPRKPAHDTSMFVAAAAPSGSSTGGAKNGLESAAGTVASTLFK